MNKPPMSWEQAVAELRGRPDQRELVEQNFYDDPVANAARRYHASSEWAAVRKLLPQSPGRVLDIGAGRGISSYAFAKDGWQVTALEPDPSIIVGGGAIRELAASTGVAIEICNTWGESLPLPSASFDLVYCRAVLHHARDLGQLCREVHRVLKPGGHLLATREHVVSNEAERLRFLELHPLHRHYGGENAYRSAEYRHAIQAAGLRIELELGPLDSDINQYPETLAGRVSGLRRRFPIMPAWLPWTAALRLREFLSPVPGRLHTYFAVRS